MTKADNTGHLKALKSPPKPDPEALSPAQAAAVELLAVGKPDSEAAEAAGVTRQTVNGWRNHNTAFVAAVNRTRREMWQDSRERLRGLADKAVGVLDRALDAPPITALPAAVAVLRAVKELPPPDGPTTPEAALRQRAEECVDAEDAGRPMSFLESLEAKNDDYRAPRIAAMMERLRAGAG